MEQSNFGLIGRAEVSFVGRGLVLIDGRNLDAPDRGSNASGKTSFIPDALSWCLFGKTTGGVAGDDVVRAGSEDGTYVTVKLRVMGATYQIVRYRKHPTQHNRVLLRRLDPDKDLTCSTNPETEKKIQRTLGVQFDVWVYAIVLGQGLAYRFSSLRDQQRATLLETLIAVTDFDRAREAARSEAGAILLDLASCDGQIEELERTVANDEVLAKKIAGQIEAASKAAPPEVDDGRVAALRKELEEVDQRVVELHARIADRTQLLDDLGNKKDSAQREYDKAEAAIRAEKREIERLRGLSESAREGTCGTCGQPVAAKRSRELIDDWEKHTKAAGDRLEAARALVAGASEELIYLQEQLPAAQKRLAASEQAHELKKEQRAQLRAQITEAEKAQQVPTLLGTLKARLSECKQEALSHLQRLEEARSIRATVTENHAYSEFWVGGFQSLRLGMLRKVVAFLSERLQAYVLDLSGGTLTAKVTLNEKRVSSGIGLEVALDISTMSGAYAPSGGERDRIDLALAFALHDVAMTTSGFSSNVLVADEVGGFIDPPGVARALSLLRRKAEKLDAVFVISQNPEFKSFSYDQRILVTRKGGVSTVTQQGSR